MRKPRTSVVALIQTSQVDVALATVLLRTSQPNITNMITSFECRIRRREQTGIPPEVTLVVKSVGSNSTISAVSNTTRLRFFMWKDSGEEGDNLTDLLESRLSACLCAAVAERVLLATDMF